MGSGNTLNYSRTILLLSQLQPFLIQQKSNLHLQFQLNILTERASSFPHAPLNNSIKHVEGSSTAMLYAEWAHVDCGAIENILN